jgi:hypothetical protein
MGWDLGQGKLSTVGVASVYIFIYYQSSERNATV